MNNKTLNKCVEELKKDTPNIQYVLGMIETLIEMNQGSSLQAISVPVPYNMSQGTGPVNAGPVIMSSTQVTADELSKEEITAKLYESGKLGNIV